MIQIASPQIGKEEREAVDRVLRSGIIAQGPEVAKFEKEFAKLCGVKYAVAACNGTTAGHLVMLASGIGPGDEVITTPFSFFSTVETILLLGAVPVFVDIDPKTYNMSVDLLSDKLREAKKNNRLPKIVIPVHFAGQPCDMQAIYELSLIYV